MNFIILSGFKGGFKNELSACPGCEPLTLFFKPLSRWEAGRLAERPCRGRGSSGIWQRHNKGKGRGCEEVRGASMHAAPRTSLLLSQPLQALPLGLPHRVREDGKWVRAGCFSDWACKHSQLSFSPCSQRAFCPSAYPSAAASSGGLSNSQINSRRAARTEFELKNKSPDPLSN